MKTTINEIKGISGLKISQKAEYIIKYLLNISKYPSERQSIIENIKEPLIKSEDKVINGILGYMVYSIKTGQTSDRLLNEVFKEVRINFKTEPKMIHYNCYLNQ